MKTKLDKEEQEILDSYERGEWKRVKNFDKEMKRLRQAAIHTLRKDCRVNIRLPKYDLDGIRTKAVEDGIPYQTLIASILHKYVLGRLVEYRSA